VLINQMPSQLLLELICVMSLVSSFCGLSLLIGSLTVYMSIRFSLDRLRGWAKDDR
jgi:hypothetical protein